MKRNPFLLAGMLLLATTMLFAGGAQEAQSDGGSDVNVGLILGVGGLGDLSYNDLVHAGLVRAQEELGIDFDAVEPQSIADFETLLQQMSSTKMYDVIIAVGFDQMEPLMKVAPQFPDQKFAIIDQQVDMPNVASFVSKEEEGSFLVGVLAGLVKKSDLVKDNNTLGFISALDIPLLDRFYAGFEAGARYVNPDIKVIADYVGGNAPFSDITTAKEIALKQFSQGADIIYHAAGGSGLGLFQAAKEKDFYAIGVNSNQNVIDPDHIMASMLKRVDNAAYVVAKSVLEGNLKTGELSVLGLASDGIGYTVEATNVEIDEEIIAVIEEIRESIVAGELVVPDAHEDVEPFLASHSY